MRSINSMKWMLSISLLLIMTSCATSDFSPEEVINNALGQTENDEHSYIGTVQLTTYENEEIVEDIRMKEWVAGDGRIRIETEEADGEEVAIAVNDGGEILHYLPSENEVLMFDDPELFELNTPSAKEQTQQQLEMISDTHTVEAVGEEEVADRDAFHIQAKPKESNLFGEQELWIDKQTWMVLKMTSKSGETRVETIYEQIEFNPKIDEEKFQLDLPEDVQRTDVNDLSETEEITLEEAGELLSEPFYYVPANKDELEIEVIELNTLQLDDSERIEITFEYYQEGLPVFSLTVFETEENLMDNDQTLLDEEVIDVRGQDGLYMDLNGHRSLSWDENGLRYSIVFNDLDFTLEQFLELAKDMELLE